jgi:hypothetical protein
MIACNGELPKGCPDSPENKWFTLPFSGNWVIAMRPTLADPANLEVKAYLNQPKRLGAFCGCELVPSTPERFKKLRLPI